MALENKEILKITTKYFYGFRRKEKTVAIIFYIKKAYNKINKNKSLKQLENMGIQGKMMEFIRELTSERWIKVRVGVSTSQNRRTDLGIPQKE